MAMDLEKISKLTGFVDKFIQIKESFKQNKRLHPLCKTCNFYENKKITILK